MAGRRAAWPDIWLSWAEASAIARAVAAAGALGGPAKRSLYFAALAHGAASSGCAVVRERAGGVLGLLALATLRMPDVAVCGELLAAEGDDGEVCLVARGLMGACGSALFVAHSALGVHACELGYGVEAWVARGVDRCAELLRGGAEDVGGELPVVLDQARRATLR